MPWLSSFIASEEAIRFRMGMCENCTFKTAVNTCKKCGCVIPFKVRIKQSKCPMDYWSSEVDEGKQHFVSDEVWAKTQQK